MKSLPLLFVLAACGGATATQSASTSPATGESVPAPKPTDRVLSLRGSNTVGFSLAPKLVRAFLEYKGATDITVRDEMRDHETVWFHANLKGTSLWVEINAPGTKFGFQSLAEGHTDVVMASRPINKEEVDKLAKLGDMTAPASENVIATDGVAVIVHPNLGVTKLTTEQLRGIFSGQIKNWSEVIGGPSVPIHVFGRDKKSGTHDTFTSLVMDGKEAATVQQFEDSAALAHTVETTDGAIGYVGLPYIGQTKAVAIQDGEAEPMLPTPFTVATEDYPLSRRLFLYLPESPKDPLARELVDFALSEPAQVLAGDVGFVPLSLKMATTKPPASAPAAYSKLAGTATRLSLDFRFRLNSADLDSKALHDLDRLTRYLASPINRGRKIALVGFTDAQGTSEKNVTLGRQRATAVADLLQRRGVTPQQIESFGSALPVAPNATEQGRARNRRVEVWLQ
jgi:phosphate transport system substrate-binding protein